MISIATRGMIQGATVYCEKDEHGKEVSPCKKKKSRKRTNVKPQISLYGGRETTNTEPAE